MLQLNGLTQKWSSLFFFLFFVFTVNGYSASVGSKSGPVKGKKPGPPPIPSYQHKNEFSVVTIGTGSPITSPDRTNPSTLIQYKGKYFLVDCADGTYRNMFVKGKLNPKDIKVFLFTHLHYDHTTDFPDVFINNWILGNRHSDIIGPPRTGKLYNNLIDLYRDDIAYRMFRTPWTSEDGILKNVKVHEITKSRTMNFEGVKITSAQMTHSMYNLAYRFDVDGKSIVISGDTSYDPDLPILAKNADILVMDGSWVFGHKPVTVMDPELMPKPSSQYEGDFSAVNHASIEDIIRIAVESDTKKLILTHFNAMPPFVTLEMKKQKLAEAKEIISKSYKGELIFSTDLLEVAP